MSWMKSNLIWMMNIKSYLSDNEVDEITAMSEFTIWHQEIKNKISKYNWSFKLLQCIYIYSQINTLFYLANYFGYFSGHNNCQQLLLPVKGQFQNFGVWSMTGENIIVNKKSSIINKY